MFRLAKGSGFDGLSGLRSVQDFGSIKLCRPLLQVSKDVLLSLCEDEKIPCCDDPSNGDERYARVRMRNSMNVLRDEGLTPKRLSVTASRIERARDALDKISQKIYQNNILNINTSSIEFKIKLLDEHEEIVIRCLQRAMRDIGLEKDYAPRMEKVEALAHDLIHDLSFRKRTLGGVIFERDDAKGMLILTRENIDG